MAGNRVEPQVVGVVHARHLRYRLVAPVVEGLDAAATHGHDDPMEDGRYATPCGSFSPGMLGDSLASGHVQHLERAIAERPYEKPIPRGVDGEVVDAALDTDQRDDSKLGQRRRRSKRRPGADGRTEEPRHDPQPSRPAHRPLRTAERGR